MNFLKVDMFLRIYLGYGSEALYLSPSPHFPAIFLNTKQWA